MPLALLAILGLGAIGYVADKAGEGANDFGNGALKVTGAVLVTAGAFYWAKKAKVIK